MKADSSSISDKVAQALKSTEGQKRIANLIEDARLVLDREVAIKALGKTIRARPGLRFYLNVGMARAANNDVTVSVRFKGLEIGKVKIDSDGHRTFIWPDSKALSSVYERWGMPCEDGHVLEWRDPSVSKLCKRLVSDWNELSDHVHVSEEHEIESVMIRELSSTGTRKSNTFKGIKPVMVGGYPFQFGIPLSPSGGEVLLSKPRTRGHIDILARGNVGGQTSLMALELKRPGHPGEALFQAFVYACGLHYVLKNSTSDANTFMRHFGFKRSWPLLICAVAVVHVDDIATVKREMGRISNDPLVMNDNIMPGIIGYRYVQGRLTLEERQWTLDGYPPKHDSAATGSAMSA